MNRVGAGGMGSAAPQPVAGLLLRLRVEARAIRNLMHRHPGAATPGASAPMVELRGLMVNCIRRS